MSKGPSAGAEGLGHRGYNRIMTLSAKHLQHVFLLIVCALVLPQENVSAAPSGAGAVMTGWIKLGESQSLRFELQSAGGWFKAFYGHIGGERYGAVGQVVLNEEGLFHLDSRERTLQSWENPEEADLWLKLLFLPFGREYFQDHYADNLDYQIIHGDLIGPQRLLDGYPISHHWFKQPDLDCHWYVHAGNGRYFGGAGSFHSLDFSVGVDSWEPDGSLDPAAFIKPRWRTLERKSEQFLRQLCRENTLYLQEALEAFHDLMTIQDDRQTQEYLAGLGYSRLPSPYPGVMDELSIVLSGFKMPLNPYTGEPMVNTYTWKIEELSKGNFYYEPVSYMINQAKQIMHFRRYTLLGFDDTGIALALNERFGELDTVEMAAFFADRDKAVEANEREMLESARTSQRMARRLAQIRKKRAEALKRQKEKQEAEDKQDE